MSISIPFVVYAEIVPDRVQAKRRVFTRSLEKIAERVKDDILDYIDANPTNSDIVLVESEISATPQIGQNPSRLTIVGFHNVDLDSFQPAGQITVDAPTTSAQFDDYDGTPGRTVNGYIGTQYVHHDQTINPDVRVNMLDLKSVLEAASPIYLNKIFKIDYMGVVFGKGGLSFQ